MHEHRFFAEGPLAPHTELALSPEESVHIRKVLRLGLGDALTLFDGRGTEATATIDALSSNRVAVRIQTTRDVMPPHPPAVHVIVPWLREPQRLDWLFEKLTEVGVERVTVLRAGRAQPEKRLERWRRLTIAAAKQSGRAWLPEVQVSAGKDLSAMTSDAVKILLSERKGILTLREVLPAAPPAALTLAVGPERGLTPDEESEADRGAWRLASLGRHRLRTETAALAALVGVRLTFS